MYQHHLCLLCKGLPDLHNTGKIFRGQLFGVYRCNLNGESLKALYDSLSGTKALSGNSLYYQHYSDTTPLAFHKVDIAGKKVLDPAREKAKLESVKKLVKNPDNVHAIDDMFAQIMANSRKNQYMLLEKMGQTLREPYEAIDEINKKNCKVVYQGVPGAYSYAAMFNFFGKDVDNFNVPTWRECMEAVKQGKADYAVLPIENSNAGIVADVYDLLQEYNNYIIAETYVKIEHLLLGLPGTELENVTAVYSHPQGLMQCDRFLDTHKDWQRISQANTALAAKMIFQEHNKTHLLCILNKLSCISNNNKSCCIAFLVCNSRL